MSASLISLTQISLLVAQLRQVILDGRFAEREATTALQTLQGNDLSGARATAWGRQPSFGSTARTGSECSAHRVRVNFLGQGGCFPCRWSNVPR